jgi:NAD(P)H-nitrite reductase large subunit
VQDLIICRCEEVSLKDLEETAKKYNCSGRELKLRTRAGMGICGGRTCRPAVDKVLTHVTNEQPTDAIPLKVAPPVRPIALADLGGGSND